MRVRLDSVPVVDATQATPAETLGLGAIPVSEWVAQVLSAEQIEWLHAHALIWHFVAIGTLLLFGILMHLLVKRVVLRAATTAARRANKDALARAIDESKVAAPIAAIVPLAIIAASIDGIPEILDVVATPISRIALAVAIIEGVIVVSRAMALADILWSLRPDVAREGALRGYRQVATVVVGILGGVCVIAALLGQNPATLLLAVGAAGALLGVIFKDLVLSLVANLMVTSTDSIRVGDWVEMKQHTIDGRIAEIKATAVRVQNADGTVHSIPISRFVQEPYLNYRSRFTSPGRRVKRQFRLDARTVRVLEASELQRLDGLVGLAAAVEQSRTSSASAITNLALYRAYIERYLAAHRAIDTLLPVLVTQETPQAQGVCIDIVAFLRADAGKDLAEIEAAILDQLSLATSAFALRQFQQPSDTVAPSAPLHFMDAADMPTVQSPLK